MLLFRHGQDEHCSVLRLWYSPSGPVMLPRWAGLQNMGLSYPVSWGSLYTFITSTLTPFRANREDPALHQKCQSCVSPKTSILLERVHIWQPSSSFEKGSQFFRQERKQVMSNMLYLIPLWKYLLKN